MTTRGRRRAGWLTAAAALVALAGPGAAETAAERDARMAWWREARFGMFIHWGVYSVPAGAWKGKPVNGIGEWIMNTAKIPVAEYAALAQKFNPVRFDADAWVAAARDAGQKYIVITAKHHDGFAMFHSRATPFNIHDATPFGRDPLAELAAACRRHGMRLGFYYSQAQDWHHPGGAAYGGHWDRAQDGNMDDYLDRVAVPQVRELLTRYGPVAVLWWDTPADMTKARAEKFLPLLALQPGLVTNNRLGGGVAGDTDTPEQEIPSTGMAGRDWETCMTMNDTWGFKAGDRNWKTADSLVRNLVDIASKGGNYLLNVGPTAQGEIPPASLERLRAIGRWLKVNGEAIYATTASPFRRLAWGRCTRRGARLYLHVFDRPADGVLTLPGLATPVRGARLLAAPGTTLLVESRDGTTQVRLPAQLPDPKVSVVVLDLAAEPQVDNTVLVRPGPDGALRLAAVDATVHGTTARYESGGGHDNIGYWTDTHDRVAWEVELAAGGRYTVDAAYACEDATAGSKVEIGTAAARVTLTVTGTGSWTAFITRRAGLLDLPPGRSLIEVVPAAMPGFAVMNLKALELKPAAR